MDKVQLNVWIGRDERDELRQFAGARDVSIGQLVREALDGYLNPGRVQTVVPAVDERTFELLMEHRDRLVRLEEQNESYEQRLSRIEELASQSSY